MSLVCCTPRRMVTNWTPFDAFRDEISRTLGWVPSVDVRESDTAYSFDVEVPGLTKEEIQVEAENNLLTIRGERKQCKESECGTARRTERRFGRFERTFEIGDGFDADKIDARLENGVLHVTLPKREEAKARHIKVTVN